MTKKIWEIAPRKFDDLIDQLLFNRGVIKIGEDDKAKEKFFNPDFERDLLDPYLIKNMEKAVLRIEQAVVHGEKVGIFGDYDADGIPGSALLYKALKKIGLACCVYIPNRENGYGLSREGLDYLQKQKCSLMITVDLGIRNFAEAEYAKTVGLDLIITDHHLPEEEIPQADIVINLKQKGDPYPFKDLCGCGVVFKLVQALGKKYVQIDEKFLKWSLDLVAISTISDVVPLSGENRILAKYGLIVLQRTKNLGIAKLIETTNLDPKKIGAYAVGFQIGPRINAPGRIDKATKSFELLVTDDETEARELALWLNEKNESRQKSMDETEKEAVALIDKFNLAQEKIIIVAGDWQKGVIGPTASRIVERYSRPAILFSKGEHELIGSARSVSGVNIVDLFTAAKDTIHKFGGHAGAAGISILKEKFDIFRKKITTIANKEIKDDDLTKKIRVDAEIPIGDLNKKLYEKLLRFEPFGMENSRPTFLAEDVCFNYPRFVGKESQHFSASVNAEHEKIKSICFNFPYEKSMIKSDNSYDLVFTLGLDEWNGESKLSLNIIDLKTHNQLISQDNI